MASVHQGHDHHRVEKERDLIVDKLHLQLHGLWSDEDPHFRKIMFEFLDDRLPKGAQARVRFHMNNIRPNAWAEWHIHNGPSYHLVLQGRVAIERIGEEPPTPAWRYRPDYMPEYHAGQAFTEPVGLVHRAGNPDSKVEVVSVSFLICEIDRNHIIKLGDTKPSGTPL